MQQPRSYCAFAIVTTSYVNVVISEDENTYVIHMHAGICTHTVTCTMGKVGSEVEQHHSFPSVKLWGCMWDTVSWVHGANKFALYNSSLSTRNDSRIILLFIYFTKDDNIKNGVQE